MKARGFTLIELLIVIAIIGVLATILVVSVGYVKTKAKVAKTKTLLQNVAQALSQYMSDTNGVPPTADENQKQMQQEFESASDTVGDFFHNQALADGLCRDPGDGGGPNAPYLKLKGFVELKDANKGKRIGGGQCRAAGNGAVEIVDAFHSRKAYGGDGKIGQAIRYRTKWRLSGGQYVEEPSMQKEYELLSIGPNGRFDQGKGDDILWD